MTAVAANAGGERRAALVRLENVRRRTAGAGGWPKTAWRASATRHDELVLRMTLIASLPNAEPTMVVRQPD